MNFHFTSDDVSENSIFLFTENQESNLVTSTEPKMGRKKKKKNPVASKPTDLWVCKDCNLACHTKFNLMAHLQGSRHKKRLKRISPLNRQVQNPLCEFGKGSQCNKLATEVIEETDNQVQNPLSESLTDLESSKPVIGVIKKSDKQVQNPLYEFVKNSQRSEPVIGLNHIVQFLCTSENVSPLYFCKLCGALLRIDIIFHVTGLTHRNNYLQNLYPEIVSCEENEVKPMKVNTFLKQKAMMVEQMEGHGKIQDLTITSSDYMKLNTENSVSLAEHLLQNARTEGSSKVSDSPTPSDLTSCTGNKTEMLVQQKSKAAGTLTNVKSQTENKDLIKSKGNQSNIEEDKNSAFPDLTNFTDPGEEKPQADSTSGPSFDVPSLPNDFDKDQPLLNMLLTEVFKLKTQRKEEDCSTGADAAIASCETPEEKGPPTTTTNELCTVNLDWYQKFLKTNYWEFRRYCMSEYSRESTSWSDSSSVSSRTYRSSSSESRRSGRYRRRSGQYRRDSDSYSRDSDHDSRDSGRYRSSRDSGRYRSSRDSDRYRSSRDSDRYRSSRDSDRYRSSRDSDRYRSSRDSGRNRSSRDSGRDSRVSDHYTRNFDRHGQRETDHGQHTADISQMDSDHGHRNFKSAQIDFGHGHQNTDNGRMDTDHNRWHVDSGRTDADCHRNSGGGQTDSNHGFGTAKGHRNDDHRQKKNLHTKAWHSERSGASKFQIENRNRSNIPKQLSVPYTVPDYYSLITGSQSAECGDGDRSPVRYPHLPTQIQQDSSLTSEYLKDYKTENHSLKNEAPLGWRNIFYSKKNNKEEKYPKRTTSKNKPSARVPPELSNYRLSSDLQLSKDNEKYVDTRSSIPLKNIKNSQTPTKNEHSVLHFGNNYSEQKMGIRGPENISSMNYFASDTRSKRIDDVSKRSNSTCYQDKKYSDSSPGSKYTNAFQNENYVLAESKSPYSASFPNAVCFEDASRIQPYTPVPDQEYPDVPSIDRYMGETCAHSVSEGKFLPTTLSRSKYPEECLERKYLVSEGKYPENIPENNISLSKKYIEDTLGNRHSTNASYYKYEEATSWSKTNSKYSPEPPLQLFSPTVPENKLPASFQDKEYCEDNMQSEYPEIPQLRKRIRADECDSDAFAVHNNSGDLQSGLADPSPKIPTLDHLDQLKFEFRTSETSSSRSYVRVRLGPGPPKTDGSEQTRTIPWYSERIPYAHSFSYSSSSAISPAECSETSHSMDSASPLSKSTVKWDSSLNLTGDHASNISLGSSSASSSWPHGFN
ncbi:uncharacterized protein LOC114663544 isoform X3 [Erpetoichthys calabaricus]|uniref:uncharacterized protein LOC114663544 isoform X3 n=1 Tax=Erpetoichthys calabaricus TaxID=27687 RepID=UPI0022345240|nr:uncharacterized protein LOC114663544 isoform X3 [Erpetoichthys calabaricus]